MLRLFAPFAAASVLAGCAAEAPFSLDDCGRTCGDGPFFLVDQMEFILEEEAGIDGFDLDGLTEDCGIQDSVAPSGDDGIDNQLARVWDALPDTVSEVLPLAIETSLQSGAMMLVLELVEGPDGSVEALVFREGVGEPLVGTDGRPLPDQTVDLLEGDNVLGTVGSLDGDGAALRLDGLEVLLKLQWLNVPVEMPVFRGRGEVDSDGRDGLDLMLGGLVPLEGINSLVSGLGGGGDDRIRELLEALLPLVVDARLDPEGDCDGLSGAFRGHASPVYLFEE